ncbi:MAG: hypothetical protein LBI79_03910 [Nitrososphaerota archaeon]|jgi:hypothetical protein|nr:hypothetical protein [Nitrososphaerota archaeon]
MGQREIILHTLMKQQHEMSMQILKALPPDTQDFEGEKSAENSTTAESVPNKVRTTQTTASRMSEPFQAEKTLQNMEKMQTPPESYREAEKIARYLYDLKNSYVVLAQNRSLLKLQYDKDVEAIPRLYARADIMEENFEKIKAMQDDVAELRVQRENLPYWAYKRKRKLDTKIERTVSDVHVAEQHFNSKYHIPLHDAPYEIKRIRNEARFKERELERKNVKMAEIAKELEAIDAEYRVQWQLAEKHAYRGLIENLLTQMRVPQTSALDNLQQAQTERNLDTAKNRKKGKG